MPRDEREMVVVADDSDDEFYHSIAGNKASTSTVSSVMSDA